MKEYALTAHAACVVAARNIELDWLNRVLEHPERIEEDAADSELIHSLGRIAEYGNRVLRVVHSRTKPKRVVTAYFDRTMRTKL